MERWRCTHKKTSPTLLRFIPTRIEFHLKLNWASGMNVIRRQSKAAAARLCEKLLWISTLRFFAFFSLSIRWALSWLSRLISILMCLLTREILERRRRRLTHSGDAENRDELTTRSWQSVEKSSINIRHFVRVQSLDFYGKNYTYTKKLWNMTTTWFVAM